MTGPTRAPAHSEAAVRRILQRFEIPEEGGPEERRLRQLDHLEGIRRLYAREFGHVPTWWAALKREVEAGRL